MAYSKTVGGMPIWKVGLKCCQNETCSPLLDGSACPGDVRITYNQLPVLKYECSYDTDLQTYRDSIK